MTLKLSMDADRQNMIDNAGNCGIEVIYNDKGWLVEARSWGRLETNAGKDGWAGFQTNAMSWKSAPHHLLRLKGEPSSTRRVTTGVG